MAAACKVMVDNLDFTSLTQPSKYPRLQQVRSSPPGCHAPLDDPAITAAEAAQVCPVDSLLINTLPPTCIADILSPAKFAKKKHRALGNLNAFVTLVARVTGEFHTQLTKSSGPFEVKVSVVPAFYHVCWLSLVKVTGQKRGSVCVCVRVCVCVKAVSKVVSVHRAFKRCCHISPKLRVFNLQTSCFLQKSSERGPNFVSPANDLTHVLSHVFIHLPTSPMIRAALERLAAPTAAFFSGAAKRVHRIYTTQLVQKVRSPAQDCCNTHSLRCNTQSPMESLKCCGPLWGIGQATLSDCLLTQMFGCVMSCDRIHCDAEPLILRGLTGPVSAANRWCSVCTGSGVTCL